MSEPIKASLKDVDVEFQIYDTPQRSLKNNLIAAATGGTLARDSRNRIVVKALDDVSVDLEHGDRIALIGHNGAGKTTLLRVLAGIYEPTRGEVALSGSVAAVFNVGLGIDLEATGRENIYLRSLFLGIGRKDAQSLSDEILDFAELGNFADMPVRTYSTGMLARLQFAITTAVQPDILLIDEGIGAGDAAFFAKAQQRMDELMARSGILVLASHSEGLVRSMCNKAMLLNHGKVVFQGDIDDTYAAYADLIAL